MARARAQYELVAQDRTQAAFDRVQGRMERTRQIALRLSASLGLLIGAAGFGRLASESVRSANEIGKLARQFGNSTQFLSEMRGVLSLTGVEWGSFTTALRTSSKAIDDASNGLKTQIRAFDALNLNVDRLKRLSPDQQFEAIVEALRRMGPGFRQTAAAQAVFGRGGAELLRLANLQRGEFEALREEQRNLGRSLSEDQTIAAENVLDAFDRMGQAAAGLADQFTLRLAPDVTDAANVFRSVVGPAIEFVRLQFQRTGKIIGAVGAALTFLFQGQFARAADVAKAAWADVVENIQQNVDFIKDPTGFSDRALQDRVKKGAQGLKRTVRDALAPDDGEETVVESELSKVQRLISALRQVESLKDQAKRGSSAVIDTSLQSLSAGAGRTDTVLEQGLKNLERILAQRELLKVMSEVRDILRSRDEDRPAVFA